MFLSGVLVEGGWIDYGSWVMDMGGERLYSTR